MMSCNTIEVQPNTRTLSCARTPTYHRSIDRLISYHAHAYGSTYTYVRAVDRPGLACMIDVYSGAGRARVHTPQFDRKVYIRVAHCQCMACMGRPRADRYTDRIVEAIYSAIDPPACMAASPPCSPPAAPFLLSSPRYGPCPCPVPAPSLAAMFSIAAMFSGPRGDARGSPTFFLPFPRLSPLLPPRRPTPVRRWGEVERERGE